MTAGAGDGPFDLGLEAMTGFWMQAGRAAMDAQLRAGQALADAMKAVPTPGGEAPSLALPGLPAMPGVPADMGQAGKAMAEMWSAAAGLSDRLSQALAGRGTAMDATLRAMADPRAWLAGMGGLDGVAGAVAEGPQLADLWSAERQGARMAQAWLEVRRRALEHNAVLLDAWMQAGRAFMEALSRADGTLPDAKAMQALWIETANRVLLEVQRSERFLQAQAATIRAGTELRLAQTEMAERWARSMGLPTRTELDDVHRTMTALRRDLRVLQRQRGVVGRADAVAPTAAPASVCHGSPDNDGEEVP